MHSSKNVAPQRKFQNVQSKTPTINSTTTVICDLLTAHKHSQTTMPALTPADKAFVVAEYYVGSSASQIQRKFKRDRNKSVSLPTVSWWLKRVKSDFVTTCSLQRKVGITCICCVLHAARSPLDACIYNFVPVPMKTDHPCMPLKSDLLLHSQSPCVF